MRQPRFIKMERIDFAVQLFLDFFDIVENAVIGALRDCQDAGLFLLVFCKGVSFNFLLNIVPGKF
jgi:hypothetical protein